MYPLIFNTITISKFPQSYGKFPYFSEKVGNGLCKQIPIQINPCTTDSKKFPGVCLTEINVDEIRSFEKDRDSLLHYRLLQKQKR
jgi:hypothetical protein